MLPSDCVNYDADNHSGEQEPEEPERIVLETGSQNDGTDRAAIDLLGQDKGGHHVSNAGREGKRRGAHVGVARAIANSSEEAVDSAHAMALAPFRQSDGSYRVGATFRCLLAHA